MSTVSLWDCRWCAQRTTGTSVSIEQALEHILDTVIPGDEKIKELVSVYQDRLHGRKQVKKGPIVLGPLATTTRV